MSNPPTPEQLATLTALVRWCEEKGYGDKSDVDALSALLAHHASLLAEHERLTAELARVKQQSAQRLEGLAKCGLEREALDAQLAAFAAALSEQQPASAPEGWRQFMEEVASWHIDGVCAPTAVQGLAAKAKRLLSASPAAPEQPTSAPDVDALAQFIRSIDGRHALGAGVLAERICEWLSAAPAAPAAQPAGDAAIASAQGKDGAPQ